jgi:hypothetical protein
MIGLGDLKEAVTHPVATASAITSAVGGLLFVPPDVLFGAIWASLGTLVPASTLTAFTLAPRFDWLPVGILEAVALLLGGLYVVKLLVPFGKRLLNRSET